MRSIAVGISIALIQTAISNGALYWAWNKKFVYWVWGGGMLFRMMVFAATAYVVYRFTTLSFVGTMISMVVATTILLVVESWILFAKKN